jgi:MFS family permease
VAQSAVAESAPPADAVVPADVAAPGEDVATTDGAATGSTMHPDATHPDAAGLSAVVRSPGSWLGFWTHMVTSFSVNVFTLMWGYPFLVVGQGLTPGQASGLLTLNVVFAILAGPLIGEFTARHPLRRSWAVITIGVGVGLAWLMVIAPSTPRPLWQLALFVAVLAFGGPGSVIGFDYARTFNPPRRLGAATGMVNIGGFSAAVAAIFGIGLVLDHVRPDGRYTLGDFRVALAVIFVPWAISMVGVIVSRARTRARMAHDDGVVVPPLAEAWARWRARR